MIWVSIHLLQPRYHCKLDEMLPYYHTKDLKCNVILNIKIYYIQGIIRRERRGNGIIRGERRGNEIIRGERRGNEIKFLNLNKRSALDKKKMNVK